MIVSDITLKSTPFLAIVNYMNDRMPAAACEKVLAGISTQFPDETRRVREKTMLASDRLSLSYATELIESVAAALHERPTAVAHEIGRRGAEAATGTVLRFVFALASMSSFLGKIQPVWSQLYSHGRISITQDPNARSAVVELHDFPFVSATNCARITGSFEWYGQRAERTAVVRHIACRSHGDNACRWQVTW